MLSGYDRETVLALAALALGKRKPDEYTVTTEEQIASIRSRRAGSDGEDKPSR